MAQTWNDINDPGVYKSPAEKTGKTKPVDYQTDKPEKNDKQEPEVKLVSAKWELGEAGLEFNKKCALNIKAEFLKETFRKKITCSLFVLYNGNEEDAKHKVDAYLDNDGNAKADMTLYYGNEYYDAAQEKPEATCQYKAKIEHPTATAILESELLDMPQCMAVNFVEIADIHFHHNCALPCLDEKGELIGLLASAFTYAKNNPDRELIVHGHADTSGAPNYNLAISKRRAEAIKGLLDNDMTLWNGVVTCNDHKLETEDYQQTLKGLSGKYGWDCDPGDVDNKDGPKTKEAVKGFQTEYNSRYNGTLTVDGDVGPKTWEAIGITIRSLLEEYLKNDLKLDSIPTIAYGYPDGKGIYPCGESCPIENARNSDYKSEENRRVELVFYKKDDPTPAIAPSAGRKIGIKKDPVSEKNWKKTAVSANSLNDDGLVSLKMEEPRIVCGSKTITSDGTRRFFEINGTTSNDLILDSKASDTFTPFDQATAGTPLSVPFTVAKDRINAGLKLYLEFKKHSNAKDATEIVVAENAGAEPKSTLKITVAEVGFDVYMTKKEGDADANVVPDDKKTTTGRFIHVQNPDRQHSRAKIVVKRVVPNDFEGTLVLSVFDVASNSPANNKLELFETELPAAGDTPLAFPYEIPHDNSFPNDGRTYWVQGKSESASLSDTELRLSVKTNGKVIAEGIDKARFTIVNFKEIKSTIEPTPANTARTGIAAPEKHEFKSKSYSTDFAVNEPLVLMRNAQPNITLEVTAAPNDLPISWVAIRNKNDAATIGSATDLPMITADNADVKKATLGIDQKGSFHIRPYIDCNGSGTFDPCEPSIPLLLVLADTTWIADKSALHAGNLRATVEDWGVSIANGKWARAPLQAADMAAAGMAMELDVDVVGGGSDGRLGLDRVFAGLINNLRPVDISLVYRDSSGVVPVDYSISNIYVSNRTSATGEYVHANPRDSYMFKPGDPAPSIFTFPLLDTGRPNGGQGGESATMTQSIKPDSVNRPLGYRWTIKCIDCPGRGFVWDHPDHPDAHLHSIHYVQKFSAHFCFWTNVRKSRPATGDAADRVYSVVNSGPWEVTGDWDVIAPSGGHPGVIANTAPHTGTYNGAPVNPMGRAQDHGIEVRPPSGITAGIAWATT